MPETNRPALPPRWIKGTEWPPSDQQNQHGVRDSRREPLDELVATSEDAGLYDLDGGDLTTDQDPIFRSIYREVKGAPQPSRPTNRHL